tara:strand:+ start:568 stop:1131 length:564 start_codon:yes stop_codon:yes gene_type:complete
MPGKAKYCEHCKGYGGLFVQVIKRFGDDRIKERYPEKPAKEPCESCNGTGMISVVTDKEPVFDIDEQASAKITTRLSGDDVIYDMEEDEKPKAHIETDEEYAKRVAEDPGDVVEEESDDESGSIIEKEVEVPDDLVDHKDIVELTEFEEKIDKEREENPIDEKPVDEDDPVIFEETPIQASDEEMPL